MALWVHGLRSIENESINCQSRYEALYLQVAMMRRQKNSSDSYISSSEETPDNTPKQV